MSLNDVRTAGQSQSIWLDLREDTFRQHLVELEKRTNAIPMDPQAFVAREWLLLSPDRSGSSYTLPLEAEQQIADDLAFLAAVEEGAQSVAAVCIEEHVSPPRLVLRFAALDSSLNNMVKSALQDASNVLSQASSSSRENTTPPSAHVNALLHGIIPLHFRRLLARLRSSKWEKPKYLSRSHKKPLWQDFTNLEHRVQFCYQKKERTSKVVVEKRLHELVSIYETFESVKTASEDELPALLKLVDASFSFCTEDEIRDYAKRLQDSINTRPTRQVASAIKCFRQIEKIAAYRRICVSLVMRARQYPNLFENGIIMAYLTPYKSVPTSIGHETWANTCHVHAEIQLSVFYDLIHSPESGAPLGDPEFFHQPRAIGTSKWLCYLCYLFLKEHKGFFPSKTHGRLYDQWTVPDLAEFDQSIIHRYRHILDAMDTEVIRQFNSLSEKVLWRAEPMTSRQDLFDLESLKSEIDLDKTS